LGRATACFVGQSGRYGAEADRAEPGVSLPELSGSRGWIAVATLIAYVGLFAVGLGPVFWLIRSEIHPLRFRSRAMSVGTAAIWSANFMLTQVLGKAATFRLYAAVSIEAWFFAFLLVPRAL
jgi:SP family galactose:H+ symporter-like MFS transporter